MTEYDYQITKDIVELVDCKKQLEYENSILIAKVELLKKECIKISELKSCLQSMMMKFLLNKIKKMIY